jgi:hypothetical protein
MSRSKGDRSSTLPANIRRQIGTEANMRYLRALPEFRVDAELPIDLRRILGEMKRAEARSTRNER